MIRRPDFFTTPVDAVKFLAALRLGATFLSSYSGFNAVRHFEAL